MQIIDMIHGNNFMAKFNLSVSTDTIIEDMKKLTQLKWFEADGLFTVWMLNYKVPLSLIPTKYGLCFNFNMIDSSELLNFDA